MRTLLESPLLIARRARSAGGRGGRRITLVVCDDAAYRVRTEGDVSREVLAVGPLQAVQAFNLALCEAARAGLTSVPEPVALTVEGLASAEQALAPEHRRTVPAGPRVPMRFGGVEAQGRSTSRRAHSAPYPFGMAVTAASVTDTCLAARAAARRLAALETGVKDAALHAIADALAARSAEILEANARDVEAGQDAALSDALLDRLTLTPARLDAIAGQVRDIAGLSDPVGEVIEGRRLPNGLDVRKVRVPLGVVAVVYEARPNVTIDAAALCLKSGNAIVLRGSSSAVHSNAVLAAVAADAAREAGVPDGAIALVSGGGREELAELATQSGVVDLIIPRGGEGLKAALSAVATVPVIYAASGNCHVFVDASADLDDAVAIVLNAKVQRPGVCNAAETLLVHADAAPAFLPRVLEALIAAGVQLRVDGRGRALAGSPLSDALVDAVAEDWDAEFLSLTLAVGVVDSVQEAIDHVNAHGSGHSEAILTADVAAGRAFEREVDAACVYVNASTRFTDGGEFGMGAEIGNSTQKLHARGPIGLRELCTTKYVVYGDGHARP